MTCSFCHAAARPGQRTCRRCHAAWMRANRRRHLELEAEARRKANCRSYARAYVKRGVLIKKPCEVCGSRRVEMHHDDYSQPLRVRWRCRRDHLALHRSAALAVAA